MSLNTGEEEHLSENGMISFTVPIGTNFQVVGIKEGYNRFSSSYTAHTDLEIKVSLAESSGNYFVDIGDIKDDNPLTDAFGVAGVVPYEIVMIAGSIGIFGLFFIMKK